MPDMMEIYKNFANNYDALVNAEDYENNLQKFLLQNINWDDKTVYEAGIGTGRVTQYFIDKTQHCYGFDREQHMLDKCAANHTNYNNKLTLAIGQNENLPPINDIADIFIEGWSFGHTMIENSSDLNNLVEKTYRKIESFLAENGKMIIIETLGTNVLSPTITRETLGDFYNLLENKFGFEKHILSTDYKFDTVQNAAEVLGFFFGEDMYQKIMQNSQTIIPEYTGVWIKQL